MSDEEKEKTPIEKQLEDMDKMDLIRMDMLLRIRKRRIDFAKNYHCNTKGEPMNFDRFPHIVDLYELLAPTIVLMGSVQCMKSEFAIIDHLAAAAEGMSIFYVLPKGDLRNTFVQNRINRCIENVPEYQKIIKEGEMDSVHMKQFGKGVVKYVGSNVLTDFREFPADMVIVDEVDECDKTNVETALDRLRASDYQFRRYLGNPNIKGIGIHKFFMESDQREYYVPCSGCDEWHDMDWFETVVEAEIDPDGNVVGYHLRDKEWYSGCRRDIQMICPNCGSDLDRFSLLGQWRAQAPENSIVGYHISMLNSPINSIEMMYLKFVAALDDPGRMKTFYNSYLGLPFDAAGNKVTTELLDKNAVDGYKFAIRPGVGHIPADKHPGPCAMGIDVGGKFDVHISANAGMGKRMAE